MKFRDVYFSLVSAEYDHRIPEIIFESNGSVRKIEEIYPIDLTLDNLRDIVYTVLFQSMFFSLFETKIRYTSTYFGDTITSKQLKDVAGNGTEEDVYFFVENKVTELAISDAVIVTTTKKPNKK